MRTVLQVAFVVYFGVYKNTAPLKLPESPPVVKRNTGGTATAGRGFIGTAGALGPQLPAGIHNVMTLYTLS